MHCLLSITCTCIPPEYYMIDCMQSCWHFSSYLPLFVANRNIGNGNVLKKIIIRAKFDYAYFCLG